MADAPIAYPLGGPSVSGTLITVDELLQSPTVINETVRDLVGANEGYWAEEVFSTPGFSVDGGAILYHVSDPTDHFLKAGQSVAPRAPLAETPLVSWERGEPLIAKVEPWAGAFEVSDEARRRNRVDIVTKGQQRVANTLAQVIQTRAIATLQAFITAQSRTVAAPAGWRIPMTNGVPNADPAETILATLGLVEQTFEEDKSGVMPDTLIVSSIDKRYARLQLPGSKLRETLADFGISKIRSSPLVTAGTATFVKSGDVGYIAFEQPLDTEPERLTSGRRGWRYNMEATPVFIANDASAVLQVTGIDDDEAPS